METIAFGTRPNCKKYGQVFAMGGCSNCAGKDERIVQCRECEMWGSTGEHSVLCTKTNCPFKEADD